jgi:glycosyltransferase 2 family protein
MKFKKTKTALGSFYIKHKKKIFTALRILISAGLISYLVFFSSERQDFRTFLNILKTVNIALIIASASIYILFIWLSALRWQILLKTQRIRLSQGFLSCSFLIGFFFNNLLPTSIGGDIFRTIDISKKAGVSIGKSASIIVIERFSGVVSAAIYTIIALLLGFTRVGKTSYVIPVVIFFIVCIILVFIILNPSIFRLNKIVQKIKFLSNIREKLREIYHTFLSFKKYKLALVEALFCSFALQMLAIVNYYLASKAMGIELSFASFIFIVPVVATVALLPISIGGTGIRENSFVLLMVALGAPRNRSTVVSLLLFAMLLALGLIGAIIYIVRPLIQKRSEKVLQ